MTGKASAIIRLSFPSEKAASIIHRALNPETKSSPTYRSKVQILQEGTVLKLVFESKDTTALRASINSYLSWLQLLNDVQIVLESQER